MLNFQTEIVVFNDPTRDIDGTFHKIVVAGPTLQRHTYRNGELDQIEIVADSGEEAHAAFMEALRALDVVIDKYELGFCPSIKDLPIPEA